MIVAPQNHVETSSLLDGRADDDALDAAHVEVIVQFLLDLEELPRAFHDQFDAHPPPIDVLVILASREGDELPVHGESRSVVERDDLLVPRTVDRVVLDEVRGRLAGAEVVDVNHVEEGIVERVSEDETSDATEAVDGAGYHDCSVRGCVGV